VRAVYCDMPYVRRSAQGEVVSLHRHAEAGTSE